MNLAIAPDVRGLSESGLIPQFITVVLLFSVLPIRSGCSKKRWNASNARSRRLPRSIILIFALFTRLASTKASRSSLTRGSAGVTTVDLEGKATVGDNNDLLHSYLQNLIAAGEN